MLLSGEVVVCCVCVLCVVCALFACDCVLRVLVCAVCDVLCDDVWCVWYYCFVFCDVFVLKCDCVLVIYNGMLYVCLGVGVLCLMCSFGLCKSYSVMVPGLLFCSCSVCDLF